MKRFFLCNKCGDAVLITTSTGDPVEVCCNTMPVGTSGICGGGFTIVELVPRVEAKDITRDPHWMSHYPQTVAKAVDYLYGNEAFARLQKRGLGFSPA